jgi:hypothetical protein
MGISKRREPHTGNFDVIVTLEVGSEGGSPGEVELELEIEPATGSEAGETWQAARNVRKEIVFDQTRKGKRSP